MTDISDSSNSDSSDATNSDAAPGAWPGQVSQQQQLPAPGSVPPSPWPQQQSQPGSVPPSPWPQQQSQPGPYTQPGPTPPGSQSATFSQPGPFAQPGPYSQPGPTPPGQFAPGQFPPGQVPPGQYLPGQYPAGPYGYPPQYYAPIAPRNNPFAITALVCGLVQFALGLLVVLNILAAVPAIVFGAIALKQIRLRGERGRGMAIAGLVLGILGVLYFALIIVAIVVSSNTGSTST